MTASDPLDIPAADAPAAPAPSGTPDTLLPAFLASRDVPCPSCSYNLRGVQEPVCPECGHSLELGVSGLGRGRGYLLFLLLALAWVALAGGMNATRSVLSTIAEAEPNSWQTFQVFVSGGASIVSGSIIAAGGSNIAISSGQPTSIGASGNPVVVSPNGQVSRLGGRTIVTPGARATIIPPGGRATPASSNTGFGRLAWSQVRWQTWFGLGWSGLLALGALATLVVVIARRRRITSGGPSRALMAWTIALFLAYAGGHVYLFVRTLV